jgi:hypothetical protein
MALTANELRILLGADEPDYAAIAAKAGKDSGSAIAEVAKGDDTMMASKAVYLASVVNDNDSLSIIAEAAESPVSRVRLAAASALPNLAATTRNKIAEKLIDKDDVSVQKLTLRAVQGKIPASLKKKISNLNKASGSEVIRDLSDTTLKKIQ